MDWPTVDAARNYLWIALEGTEYAIKPPCYDAGQPATEPQPQGTAAAAGTAGEPQGSPRAEPGSPPAPDQVATAAVAGPTAVVPAPAARLLVAPLRRNFDPDAFAAQMQGAAQRQDLDTLNALGEQLRDVLDEETRVRLTQMHGRLTASVGRRQREAPPRRIARARAE